MLVQFSLLFQRTKKRLTGDNSERAELTKSTAITIVTNKICVSIDNCTLTQKKAKKKLVKGNTLCTNYIQLYTLFSNHTVVQPVTIFGANKFFIQLRDCKTTNFEINSQIKKHYTFFFGRGVQQSSS